MAHHRHHSGESVQITNRSTGRLRWLLIGLGLGAVVQYFGDPQHGRSRRAKTTDQILARVRRPARTAQDQLRKKRTLARDRTRGVVHEVMTHDAERLPEDDRALADKVRSEALGGEQWRPYTINVNAVAGVVTLRGQLDREEQIELLEATVRGVPGVGRVESFLHLPDEPAPNVETARQRRPG